MYDVIQNVYVYTRLKDNPNILKKSALHFDFKKMYITKDEQLRPSPCIKILKNGHTLQHREITRYRINI